MWGISVCKFLIHKKCIAAGYVGADTYVVDAIHNHVHVYVYMLVFIF